MNVHDIIKGTGDKQTGNEIGHAPSFFYNVTFFFLYHEK